MAFFRQEYWNGLPFPSSGDILDSGIKPASPALASGFFTTVPSGKPHFHVLDFFKEKFACRLSQRSKWRLKWYFFNIFYLFIYLFIYFWLCWVFLCMCFLSLSWARAILHCGTWASHCGGFSCCGAQALGAQASVGTAHGLSSCGSQALEHGLSSCGTWPCCSKACGIFWGQGSNPYSLHWQADSYPLYHQGSPNGYLLIDFVWGGNGTRKECFFIFLEQSPRNLGQWVTKEGKRCPSSLYSPRRLFFLRPALRVTWPQIAKDLPMLISSSVRVSPMKSNWKDCNVWENFWTAEE